jgi:predicted glycosyltransferase
MQQKADEVQVGGDHYKTMPIQPWNVMEVVLSRIEFIGYLKGNYVKYAMRAGHKGPESEDANKARHYKQKLDEVLNDR